MPFLKTEMIIGVQLRVLCSILLYRRILILKLNYEKRRNLRFILEQSRWLDYSGKDVFRPLKEPGFRFCLGGYKNW